MTPFRALLVTTSTRQQTKLFLQELGLFLIVTIKVDIFMERRQLCLRQQNQRFNTKHDLVFVLKPNWTLRAGVSQQEIKDETEKFLHFP